MVNGLNQIRVNNNVRFNAILDISFTDTGSEPCTLQEAKDFAKIDVGTTDDTIVTYLIKTARQQCEDYTGISFIARTVTAVVNNSCSGVFLPYGPIGAITSITDSDGNILVANDDYKLSGVQWKQLINPVEDRLTLIYSAGYTSLPQELKTAVLQQVLHLYENRDGKNEITLSPQAKSILSRIRRV